MLKQAASSSYRSFREPCPLLDERNFVLINTCIEACDHLLHPRSYSPMDHVKFGLLIGVMYSSPHFADSTKNAGNLGESKHMRTRIGRKKCLWMLDTILKTNSKVISTPSSVASGPKASEQNTRRETVTEIKHATVRRKCETLVKLAPASHTVHALAL